MLIEVEEVLDPAVNYTGLTSPTSSAWINLEHISYIGAASLSPASAPVWKGTVIMVVGRKHPIYVNVEPAAFVHALRGQLGDDTHDGRASRGIRFRTNTEEKVAHANV